MTGPDGFGRAEEIPTEGGSTATNSVLERILQSGRTLTADGTGEKTGA